ncbi:MAG: hypothetical protein CVU78_07855 [Elusimicrobia bacterium HGW-Elusimicrobia-2]|nr:MAG: hypothetical protein CVU78_07855 [Elusimicrobia bacterium HGW-Elusimicrobia-2]
MDIKTILAKDNKQSGVAVTFKAKVINCHTSTSKIKQSGRLSDSTGNIRFVIWADSKLPLLTEGSTYLFKKARGKFYEQTGSMEVHLTKYTEIISSKTVVLCNINF